MKTRKKVLTLALCAVLLVVASVGLTVAYLTSNDSVTNTFTVGKVGITLDEAKVNEYGVVDATASNRVKANEYKLVPGHEYAKDPIVHFAAKSEASYLFVKVENGIANIEKAGTTTIDAQIKANGWAALDGVAGVYYKTVDANATENAVDYPVFAKFIVASDADVATYDGATVKVTAYAVQKDGLTVTQAWAAANQA